MATDKKTALDTLYFVNNSVKNITLEIILGGIGQTGKMSIDIDGNDIATDHDGNFAETAIGSNKSLQSKTLTIVCNVADTSRDTNYTEMIVCLNGGIIYQRYPLYATVENEGDSVDYTCIIKFFKP